MKALIDADEIPTERFCKICSILKPLNEFVYNKECFHERAYQCKRCAADRSNKWSKDNRQRRQEAMNVRNRSRKIQAIELLGGSCKDCGGTFPPCAFDFHHVDGTKEMNPSYALANSWDKAVTELEKCLLLCANCHRIRHFEEGTTE